MPDQLVKFGIILFFLPLLATSLLWLRDVRNGDAMGVIEYAPMLLVFIIAAFILFQLWRLIRDLAEARAGR
ncbi:hypothetical protein [Alteribacter natronophilus]|uniref:hypothetical protein n=1 Tax=Alteribacter natronophilus TaxID=2583810 RepID=UPI00110EA924|nr:hypothetical protein [Alteribacter natronophilus]TMW70119.1 hypothetical protein FGB90_18300 [Alteribacter natronophilus]